MTALYSLVTSTICVWFPILQNRKEWVEIAREVLDGQDLVGVIFCDFFIGEREFGTIVDTI